MKPDGKFSLWTLVPLFLLLAMAPALAADKGGITKADAEAIAPIDRWSGAYVSGSIGVVSGVNDFGAGLDGYGYGVRVGYDLKVGVLVLGGLMDYDWKHVTFAGTTITPHSWDFGGRAGILVNPSTLLYGIIVRPTLTVPGMADQAGLGFGGGIETKLNDNFSMSLEYMRKTYDNIPTGREGDIMTRLTYKMDLLSKLFSGNK